MIDFPNRQGRTGSALYIVPERGTLDPASPELLAAALEARFTAVEEVLVSAYSTIYLAEEREYGRLVQLEVLSDHEAENPAEVELFYHEADTAARLHHPHIARSEAASPIATTHFRLTEQVRGAKSLRTLLADQGWLETQQAVQIIAQVANALEYAHRNDVLHLNLHPEHVLLDTNGEVVVCGFGVGTGEEVEWMRETRTQRCPASYLSPEQIGGQDGSRQSDLYALGVMLYELLTDRVPFDSDDLVYLKHRQRIQVPQAPHNFRPELPRELSELVMALLARSPEARELIFSSAASFSAALKRSCAAPSANASANASVGLAARATNPLLLDEISAAVIAADQVGLRPRKANNDWLLRKLVYYCLRLEPLLARVPARSLVLPLFLLLALWAAFSTSRSNVQTSAPVSASSVSQNQPLNQPKPAIQESASLSTPLNSVAQTSVPNTTPFNLPKPASPSNSFSPPNRTNRKIPLSAFPRRTPKIVDASETAFPQALFPRSVSAQTFRSNTWPDLGEDETGSIMVEAEVNERGEVIAARALPPSATFNPSNFREEGEENKRQKKFKPSTLIKTPLRAVKKFFSPRSSRRPRR